MKLTNLEISALLAVAGAADAPAVFEDCSDDKEGDRSLKAFERAIRKLRSELKQRHLDGTAVQRSVTY